MEITEITGSEGHVHWLKGEIPDHIAKYRPSPIGVFSTALCRFDGTNVCQWHAETMGGWVASGPLFRIES